MLMKKIYIRGFSFKSFKKILFLNSFVRQLLTKPTTKETVQNELVEVFGPESQKLQIFLDWLWSFLPNQEEIFQQEKEKRSANSKTIQPEAPLKNDKNPRINLKKPLASQKERPILKNNNIVVSAVQNNNNLKSKNNKNGNDVEEEQNVSSEQHNKDKKSILERIKKPKAVSKINNLARDLKKNLVRPHLNINEIKEKIIEKKLKMETLPAKNL